MKKSLITIIVDGERIATRGPRTDQHKPEVKTQGNVGKDCKAPLNAREGKKCYIGTNLININIKIHL